MTAITMTTASSPSTSAPAPAPAETLRAARAAYFAASGFDERTYTDDWVDVPLGPLPLRFPNTAARKAVVPLHDLHHALTGYAADLAGEGEIAAFETGAGNGPHAVAWYLNLLTMSYAAWTRPARTFRGFVRGRRARGLYTHPLDPAELDRDVATVRAERGIEPAPAARWRDVPVYAAAVAGATAVGLLSVPTVLPLMIVLGLANRRRGATG
ncbi:MAG: hypothetical protein KC635_14265, partial [Myxococcales bacterium]|nr:hypothetical protein [Myxococcales bacterium]